MNNEQRTMNNALCADKCPAGDKFYPFYLFYRCEAATLSCRPPTNKPPPHTCVQAAFVNHNLTRCEKLPGF
jgi:hypothetical protein